MIEIKDGRKIYTSEAEEKLALDNITLDLKSRGLVLITGESGCGKTTLLNCLSGLDAFTDGDVKGVNLKHASFIFQDYQLIENISIRKNLTLGRVIEEEELLELLKKVNLENENLDKKIYNLSGGQKQRVAIARALLLDKAILFADEPTGNLDSDNSKRIAELLKELSKSKLVIVVSHDKNLFLPFADETIILEDGEIIKIEGSTYEGLRNIQEDENCSLTLSWMQAMRMNLSSIKKYFLKFFLSVSLQLVVLLSFIFMLVFLTNEPYFTYQESFRKNDFSQIDFFQKRNNEKLPVMEFYNSFQENKKISLVIGIDDSRVENIIMLGDRGGGTVHRVYLTDFFQNPLDISLKDNEIAITDYMAEIISFTPKNLTGNTVKINGTVCKIVKIISTEYDEDKKTPSLRDYIRQFSYIYCNSTTFKKIKASKATEEITLYNGWRGKKNEKLKDNEIILSYYIFNNLHLTGDRKSYIGKPISLDFVYFDEVEKKERIDTINFIIKDFDYLFHTSNEIFERIKYYVDCFPSNNLGISYQKIRREEIIELEALGFIHYSYLSEALKKNLPLVKENIKPCIYIFVFASFINLLYYGSLASASVKSKKREIGILNSMGYTKRSTYRIVLGDTLFFLLCSIGLITIITPLFILIMNNFIYHVDVLYFHYIYLLFLPLLAMLLFGLYSLFCHKIIRKKSIIQLVYEK